jgi:multidrug efflux pump
MWLQKKGSGNYSELVDTMRSIVAKAKERPELRGVSATASANSRQLLVDVDRDKAETLGVPVQDIYNSLQTLFGSMYVSQFPKDSRLWQVILQAEPGFRLKPEDIQHIYVRTREGKMVPLSAVVQTRYVTGPDLVTRFNNYPAVKITGSAAPGYSSGQALERHRGNHPGTDAARLRLRMVRRSPRGKIGWGTSTVAFVFGLIFVFLILAAQYESWSLPIGVVLAVPFALVRRAGGDCPARHSQ